MKSILLITTGGTIACGRGDSLTPVNGGEELLRKSGIEEKELSVTVLDLFSIDSTDLNEKYLREIYTAVKEKLPLYDGIVILHGTDTLAYTAAMLAFLFRDKPVIVTGSMLSLEEENSDGYANIRLALETALSGSYKGCYVAFGGRIIYGADVVKTHSTAFTAFSAYSGNDLSDYHVASLPETAGLPKIIKLTPFTGAEELTAEGSCGVVIEAYGTGGLPDRTDILSAVARLSEKMPVYITTPCGGGTDLNRYSVGQRALSLGVKETKMSTEATAVWLWLGGR